MNLEEGLNWKWTKTNNTGWHYTCTRSSPVSKFKKVTFLIEWTISTSSRPIQILCRVPSGYMAERALWTSTSHLLPSLTLFPLVQFPFSAGFPFRVWACHILVLTLPRIPFAVSSSHIFMLFSFTSTCSPLRPHSRTSTAISLELISMSNPHLSPAKWSWIFTFLLDIFTHVLFTCVKNSNDLVPFHFPIFLICVAPILPAHTQPADPSSKNPVWSCQYTLLKTFTASQKGKSLSTWACAQWLPWSGPTYLSSFISWWWLRKSPLGGATLLLSSPTLAHAISIAMVPYFLSPFLMKLDILRGLGPPTSSSIKSL